MYLFCILYYVLSYVQTVPMLYKLIKTKSSNDYSIPSTILSFIGATSWTIYIFTSNQSNLVYVGSIIDMLLEIVADYLIIKYYNS